MRTTLLILTIGLFAVNGCQNSKNSTADNETTSDSLKVLSDRDSESDEASFHQHDQPILDSATNVSADSILYSKEVLHNFSSSVDKDVFKIVVTGRTLKEGRFKFQILNKAGQVLLNESFETFLLLGYGLKPDPTDKDRVDYIKKRIYEFFNEDKFHQPAISDEKFYEDLSKKEIWDDIKSDKTAIGFYYLIGEEDGRHIAYSKKLGKVVMYFNCC